MKQGFDTVANKFGKWLSAHVPSGQLSDIYFCYPEIEKHGYKVKILKQPLLETTDVNVLSKLRAEIEQNRMFRFWHKKQMKKMGLAMTLYITFIKELIYEISSKSQQTEKAESVIQEAPIPSETIGDVTPTNVVISNSSDNVSSSGDSDQEEGKPEDVLVKDENADDHSQVASIQKADSSNEDQGDQLTEEDSGAESDHPVKERRTLRNAIIQVLREEVLLTSKEIVNKIVERDLYTFANRYSKSMVSSTLSHYMKTGDTIPENRPVDFGCIIINGKRFYYLLEKEGEINQNENVLTNNDSDNSESQNTDNHLTIREAIIKVLSGSDPLLSAEEIYNRIIAENLYKFGAQDPKHVVDVTLRASCRDTNYTKKLKTIDFGCISNEKRTLYFLLSREDEVQLNIVTQNKTESESGTFIRNDTNESSNVLVYSFTKPGIMTYTKPVGLEYFGEKKVGFASWTDLYTTLFSLLLDDYPGQFPVKSAVWLPNGSRFEIADEMMAKKMLSPKAVPGTSVYIETNYSAKDILSKIKLLLDRCYVDYENVVISYVSKESKPASTSPQKRIVVEKRNTDIIEEEFKAWMETNKKLGQSTCRGYVSAVRAVEKYAKDHGCRSCVLFTYTRRLAQATVDELFASDEFVALNKKLHNLYSAAINQLLAFIDYHNGDAPSITTRVPSTPKSEFHGRPLHPQSMKTSADLIRSGDRILNYFIKVRDQYPELEFTNVNAHGDAQQRAVYIYPKALPRKGNVLFEIWHRSEEGSFALFVKKAFLSEEEYRESEKAWDKTSDTRGRIIRKWYYKQDLIGFLMPRLDKAKNYNGEIGFSSNLQKPALPSNVDTSKYEKVLKTKFDLGFRLNSTIELKKFKKIYAELCEESISESDEIILLTLKSLCLEHDGRLYLISSIMDKDLEDKMLSYIFNMFNHGKKIVYIDALFKEFSDEILSTRAKIYNVEMLQMYLSYIANERFHVSSDYISSEKGYSADVSDEIKEYLLLSAKPVSIETIYQGLSHVSQKEIKSTLNKKAEFINNGRNHFFHVELLGFSDAEIVRISAMIRNAIDDRNYISGNELYQMVKVQFPYIVERNPLISEVGLRDGIKYYLYKEFLFEGNIISDFNNRYSITKIFTDYGKQHHRFTYRELEVLAKEIGAQIPLYAVNKNAIKISSDDFVSADLVHFQIREIDAILEQLCKGSYISIQSVTEFSAFPYAGFQWNLYLLEQFVSKYSVSFRLLSKGINRNVVAGGIVRKTSGIIDFDELLIDVLASSKVQLKKESSLSYLVEEGYLAFASHKTIEEILIKARAKRNQKEK